MITAQDIIDLLPIVSGRVWAEEAKGFNSQEVIRCARGECPLVALAKEIAPLSVDPYRRTDYWSALREAGFPANDSALQAAATVAAAADYPHVRKRTALKMALNMETEK